MVRSNRRTLERVLILGVAIPVLLTSTVSLATSNEGEITPEMIAAAEAILALEYSSADRLEIIDGLTEYREAAEPLAKAPPRFARRSAQEPEPFPIRRSQVPSCLSHQEYEPQVNGEPKGSGSAL